MVHIITKIIMSKNYSNWTLSSSDEDDESLLTDKYRSPAVVKKRVTETKNKTAANHNEDLLVSTSINNSINEDGKRKSSQTSSKSSPLTKRKKHLNDTSMNRSFDPKFIWEISAPHHFLLTTVKGIPAKDNHIARQDKHKLIAPNSLGIKDLLSPSFGELVESAQFNYCIDIEWMMKQYPQSSKHQPLLLVHGEQRNSNLKLIEDIKPYPNISLCRADLPPFGTHHTKMMFLLYTTGLRVVILTANLVAQDWAQKTQGMWVSPIFPELDINDCSSKGSSNPTHFKEDLIQYLEAYKRKQLNNWITIIKKHDMSTANVILIASVPGKSDLRYF